MFREERLRMIMELIYKNNVIEVRDLAQRFKKSSSSIRLDLTELESRGLITRTHGGAMSINSANPDFVLHKKILQSREGICKEEKERIGQATADLIHDGDTIMIDGGSTTLFVAKSLTQKRGLTIITTSIHLLPHLSNISDAKVFLTGGLYFNEFEEMIGEIAMDSIGRFKTDHTIIGIDGISVEHGLTSTEPTVAHLKRKMVLTSTELIVVSDSTKFGKACLLHVADLDKVHKIVVDTKIPKDMAIAIQNQGPSLVIV